MIALAVRQSLPAELYELAGVEDARRTSSGASPCR